jgi:Flp pilus assembly protein TadG
MDVRRLRFSRRQAVRGQALVEFAFVLPLFLAMVFAAIDLGRVIWANDMLANAAREGARYASVHGDAPVTTLVTKQQIRDHTMARLIAAGSNAVVTVCYSSVQVASSTVGCTGNDNETGVTATRGALVTVAVTADVPVITGVLLGLSDFSVTGSSTVLVNN